MTSPTRGRLVGIDRTNWRSALGVRVRDDQLPLVADHQPVALVILAKAYVEPDGRPWEPLAFVDADGEFVAVLGLTHSDEVTEVRNFAVDVDHQGRGVGAAVMAAVIDRAAERGATSVELTVNPVNDVARRLYERAGLRPTGASRGGEPVLSIETRPTGLD